ncbi:response regulator [Hylemonella gracilis]|uniref:response regulator n=1 Tax=Hylemonella gracilis TaxID=80880 RepID=UPI0002F77E03|nr:response regulator [Hylemonella gracilis]
MHKKSGPLTWSLTVFATGCIAAALTWFILTAAQEAETASRFDALTRTVVDQLKQRMTLYQYGLRGTRGAVISAGVNEVSRGAFFRYSQSRDIALEFPGSHGFGFIRRVPRANEAAFLRLARSEHGPDFQIKELAAHSDDRLVIQYIEPMAQNRAALGLDIGSEGRRRLAAVEAMRENRATLSQPLTLVQAAGKLDQGFLFFLPVYSEDVRAKAPQDRLRLAIGLAYTPLVIGEVVFQMDLPWPQLAVNLYDAEEQGGPRRFFSSSALDAPAAEGLTRTVPLELYGRRWLVEVNATPVFIQAMQLNSPRYVVGLMVGASALVALLLYVSLVSAQRRRQALIEDARLAAILDGTSDAIIGKDLHGRVTSWNRAAAEIFGYASWEAVGKTLSELIVPADRQAEELSILARIGRGETVAPIATQRLRRNGTLIDVMVTASPVRDADGQVVGAASTLHDMTDELIARKSMLELNASLEEQVKERTARLAASERFLHSLIDALPGLVSYWDTDMRCRYSNRTYQKWFGRSPEEMNGISRQELMGEELFRLNEPYIQAALRGEPQVMERAVTLPDGKTINTLANFLPVFEEGVVCGYIVVSTDVTVLKQAEEALVKAKQKAEDATQAKSDFLANMSHEIRTPMNAILGLCYLLEQQSLSPTSREMVQKIHAAGKTLLTIINDVLDFSKIEAQHMVIEQVPFRLSDVLDNLASIMSASLGSKPLELVVGPPPDGANYLIGDRLRLGQVLVNLASNAIKFTGQGEVEVRVDRLPDTGNGRVMLRFSVRDTGIGIAPDKQEMIFHAFSQADTSTTRSFGGTGLGLAISRHLVALMGGRLQVHSAPGQGSNFHFELPFELSNPMDSALPDMAHLRVLIADDHEATRKVLVDIAHSLGWHADAVATGEEAVSRATGALSEPYDLLLLDWHMPGMDGLVAAVQIRELSECETAPIIVMVTAYERERLARQEGARATDAIICKPITSSGLYNAVLEARRHRGELDAEIVRVRSSRRLQEMRVLVVDDSEINRDVARNILAGEGALVATAEDGQTALAMLREQPYAFHVVLMDMQMPVMDGYVTTRMIRSMDALAALPVIALTAGAFSTQRALALEAGVDDFVAKPFEVDQLVQAILDLVRRSSHAPEVSAPIQLVTPPQAPQIDHAAAGPTVLNAERALRVWGEPANLITYLRKFTASHRATAGRLAELPPEPAAALAHQVKGAAAQLGLEQVADLAGRMELLLRDGQDAQDVLMALQTAMEEAFRAIAAYSADSLTKEAATSAANMQPADALLGGGSAGLARLSVALRSDDPEQVEPVLDALSSQIPTAYLGALRAALAAYDFRGAEGLVRELAATLNTEKEIEP